MPWLLNWFCKNGWMKFFYKSSDLDSLSRRLSERIYRLLSALKSEKVALIWIREGGRATFEDFCLNSSWLKKISVFQSAIKISSYREESCSGELEFSGLSAEDEEKIMGATVVIFDDLIEKGKTSQGAEEYFKGLGATNVVFCFSFNKICGKRDWTPKFFLFGKEIKTEKFLVGYGLDFYGSLREIRLVFVLDPRIFKILGRWPLRPLFIRLIKKYAKMSLNFENF